MKTNKLFGGIFLLIMSLVISSLTALPAVGIGAALYGASLFPKPKGVALMALDVEQWKPWILETLFKNNEFLNLAKNADEYVLMGKVVHIANSGAASSIERNRSSLPATVTQRTDVDVTYSLDEFTSDPRLLQLTEGQVISYNKMESMMGQDMRAIKQLVAEWMLYHWRAEGAANIIRTSGGTSPAYLADATGVRKLLTLSQFEEAQAVMDENDIPDGDRYAMLDARMHQQLVQLMNPTTYKDFSKAMDLQKGIIGELYGFKFLKRSTAIRYDNTGTPVAKNPAAVNAATDNAGILVWHKDWVERAIGTTEIFEKLKDPQYYGDIYSLLIRAGGRKVEANGKGVLAIVQEVYT